MPLLPSSPISYITYDELPQYAPGVNIDISSGPAQTAATNLIQRAGAMIVARYKRTGEVITVTQEIIELTDDNMGHLMHNYIQLVTNNDNTGNLYLDPTQGDEIDARYSATMYPYAAMFGAPFWQTIDPTTVDIQPNINRVWMPPGLFPIPYAEARVTYRAGLFPVGGPYPEWIKQACGMMVENIYNRSGSTVAQKYQLADQQSVQFFDNSFFTPELINLLAPLQIRSWR